MEKKKYGWKSKVLFLIVMLSMILLGLFLVGIDTNAIEEVQEPTNLVYGSTWTKTNEMYMSTQVGTRYTSEVFYIGGGDVVANYPTISGTADLVDNWLMAGTYYKAELKTYTASDVYVATYDLTFMDDNWDVISISATANQDYARISFVRQGLVGTLTYAIDMGNLDYLANVYVTWGNEWLYYYIDNYGDAITNQAITNARAEGYIQGQYDIYTNGSDLYGRDSTLSKDGVDGYNRGLDFEIDLEFMLVPIDMLVYLFSAHITPTLTLGMLWSIPVAFALFGWFMWLMGKKK